MTDGSMRPARESRAENLVVVPAVIALVLGALYVVGAVLKASELRAAGLQVRDTLPLFSIEQLLTRGISTGVTAVVLAAFFVPLMLAVEFGYEQATRLHEEGSREPATARTPLLLWLAIGALVVVFVMAALLPPLIMGGVLAAVILRVAARRRNPAFSPVRGFAVMTSFFAVFALLNAYLEPQRLPAAVVRMKDGGIMRGKLITENGGSLYVTNRNRRYNLIARDEVRSVSVRSERARRWRLTHAYVTEAVETIRP